MEEPKKLSFIFINLKNKEKLILTVEEYYLLRYKAV
jgi:hypothetical protein